MNLKEKLAEMKSELAGLKSKVEADDSDATERANELVKSISETEKAIEAADAKAALLKSIGTNGTVSNVSEKPARTLGEHVAKSFDGKFVKGQHVSLVTPEFKANTDTNITPATVVGALTTYDTNVVTGPRRQLQIRDLFGAESISGSALTYYVEGALEGALATVAEGAKKPQLHFGDPTAVTVALDKVAGYYKESDELLSDSPWLASSIDDRAMYLLGLQEETYLVTKLLATSGIQTATATAATLADTIFSAMMAVQQNSGFAADGIVINPTDYQALRVAKDANNQYYGGGYFVGQYGNGTVTEQLPIWGLHTVVTSAIASGTVLVGAFKLGGSVVSKGGVSVDIANTNEDDFVNNRVTVRIEERMALALRYPAAFDKITVSAS